MAAQENLAVVRQFYAAFQKRDVVLLRELMTDDVVWAVPAGTVGSKLRKGMDNVVLRIHQIMERSGDSYEMELLHVASDGGSRVIALHRFVAARGGHSLRMMEPTLFTLENLRIAEFCNFYADPAAADAFWA